MYRPIIFIEGGVMKVSDCVINNFILTSDMVVNGYPDQVT